MSTRRPAGRPRKWTDDAERKRAYRARRAADLAEPERLRRELRLAQRYGAEADERIAKLERGLTRAEAELERMARHKVQLLDRVARLEAQVQFWRSRAASS